MGAPYGNCNAAKNKTACKAKAGKIERKASNLNKRMNMLNKKINSRGGLEQEGFTSGRFGKRLTKRTLGSRKTRLRSNWTRGGRQKLSVY